MLQQGGQEERQVLQQAHTSIRHQKRGPEIKFFFFSNSKQKKMQHISYRSALAL